MENMNSADNNGTVATSQIVEVKSNKMPKGMKVILFYFFFVVFLTFINIGNISTPIQNASLFGINFVTLNAFSSLFAVIVAVFYIVGIFLRRWRKSMLVLMSFNLLIFLLSSIWILSTPLTKLATTLNYELPATNLNPEQIESVGRVAKMIIAFPMAIGFIIGIIILLYIYKQKEYFRERM
jgi:hypothetical protein